MKMRRTLQLRVIIIKDFAAYVMYRVYFRTTKLHVLFQNLVHRVLSAFSNTRKLMKARGRRPSAFIVFECLETLMKPDARVFEIASQLIVPHKKKKEKGNIHEFFTGRQVCFNYEKLYCYGDLSFQKGCEQCYRNAQWMIIKSRFIFEFFTFFCNCFITFSASKISRRRGQVGGKVPCQSPLVTKIYGPMEYSNNGRKRD